MRGPPRERRLKGALARLAQGKESGSTRREARSGGGLGQGEVALVLRMLRRSSAAVATSREGLVERGGALFRRVGFIAANLIAFCRSKTVSKAVHAPPADGPCRKAGTVCVGVHLISADGTPGVSVAISVRAYTLVADRACRSAVAITVSADVLATDPAGRVAVSISVRVHSAIAVYTCRITRSIRVKDGALGVQRRNGYRQHQHCKDWACHRTTLLL